ncbi:exopolysaccharide biosynthesis polyprenyl glycosylphosphotransferase [Hyphococcus luteus]|uniref:Bacterial sugar transferase domain-containing protein n=1 Tax=Hyphococcus luteus TaxID=2058213 RepID=A0A2S7K927_9PROT|nr:exopolysaccharide biosynthesis polyprenyl glycosylphosphotransferase [Marinicaulis flavus]PQA89002.1 hypothetical protein CW354_03370 [Marinicaulis flavus]
MFAHFAFALGLAAILAAGGALASSRLVFHPKPRKAGDHQFYRDSVGLLERPVPTGPLEGAVDLGRVSPRDYETAARKITAPASSRLKRCLDIALSFGLVFCLSPLLVMTVLAIRLDSPGPVLYRQRRVGYGGREFEVIKFRSMFVGSEPHGPQYAARKDPRITRVGRFIRKFRIDEIPQAINVLRGDMSFVGPRPERPEFVAALEREIPNYHCRHLVKPGITGWAQVKYEYAASVEGARTKLRYDLYYIRHFSPALDLLIVLMTVRVALFGLGGR